MEKDAVSAGVSPIGGLFSTAQVRILICYILSNIKDPVSGRMLADTLHYEGIANVFEVNDSIAHLYESGHLKLIDEAEDTYVVTTQGRDVAETLKSSLPYTVKERAYSAALKMVSRYRRTKETDIKITREGTRSFINCTALDGDQPFMSIKLQVTDEDQAVFIKEQFLNSSDNIYAEIIALLTKKQK